MFVIKQIMTCQELANPSVLERVGLGGKFSFLTDFRSG
jgi:hypothetical protein